MSCPVHHCHPLCSPSPWHCHRNVSPHCPCHSSSPFVVHGPFIDQCPTTPQGEPRTPYSRQRQSYSGMCHATSTCLPYPAQISRCCLCPYQGGALSWNPLETTMMMTITTTRMHHHHCFPCHLLPHHCSCSRMHCTQDPIGSCSYSHPAPILLCIQSEILTAVKAIFLEGKISRVLIFKCCMVLILSFCTCYRSYGGGNVLIPLSTKSQNNYKNCRTPTEWELIT